MITERKEALREVRTSYPNYDKIDPKLFEQKEFVMEAIKAHSDAYVYASDDLKKDREIALSALTKYDTTAPQAAEAIPQELYKDSKFVNDALDGIKNFLTPRHVFLNLPEEVKAQKDICLKSVTMEPTLYYKIPENLKGDKDICLAAAESGIMYHAFPENMRKDPEVFLASAPENLFTSSFNKHMVAAIPDGMLENKEVVIRMLEKGVDAYNYLSETLKCDKDVVLHAISIAGDTYKSIPEHLKTDGDIIMATMKKMEFYCNGMTFEAFPDEIFNNKGLVVDILDQCNISKQALYDTLPERLQADEEICLKCISSEYKVYASIPETMKNNVEFNKKIAETNPEVMDTLQKWGYLPEKVKAELNKEKSEPEKKAPKRNKGLDR